MVAGCASDSTMSGATLALRPCSRGSLFSLGASNSSSTRLAVGLDKWHSIVVREVVNMGFGFWVLGVKAVFVGEVITLVNL
jgi:hypothetical protein